MSLINDALKQARKSAPLNLPPSLPLLQPVAAESSFFPGWFWPSIMVLIVGAAIFFIGWAVAHRSVRVAAVPPKAVVAAPTVAVAPAPGAQPPRVVAVATPIVKPPPVATTAASVAKPPPVNHAPPSTGAPGAAGVPVNPPVARVPTEPKLQGIFYSPTAPAAIVDGKILHVGEVIGQYRLKAISKYSITLLGPDKKEIQISMSK